MIAPDNVNKLIAERWIARRETQGLKRQTLTCKKLQMEFFLGAHAALAILGVPTTQWPLVKLAIGEDADDFL